ncbi:inositol monophosphatase [Marinomonas agarivorans]|nr:inositol monophosphatase [Marinomonas agarivorans]
MPIIREAGKLAQQFRNEGLKVEVKGRQDFVSQADVEVENFLREKIHVFFPNDGFLGEEGGLRHTTPDTEEGVWVIDPIDGTTNYLQGMDYWCISVAYVKNDVTQLGFVYAPDKNEFFFAKRNHGAYCNEKVLSIVEPEKGQAIVGLGRSNRRPIEEYLTVLKELDKQDIEYRRFGAGALMLAHVALGIVDGYYEAHMNSWDALAGSLLIEEAGGKVNDFLANNGLLEGNLVCTAAPELWETLAKIDG